MLNTVRCTQVKVNAIKPDEAELARHYIEALEHSYVLFKRHSHKLVIANFANVLLAILAPGARKLMCDISPCGGGRAFFAISASGDAFPCSEFIGVKKFKGGNIFEDDIKNILQSEPFEVVTSRKIENIDHCKNCAFIHFCGSPCTAEAYTNNGTMNSRGSFCEFYVQQIAFAFRLISENRADAFLWDDWTRDTKISFMS